MSVSLFSLVEQLKKQISEAYEATKFAASYLEEKAMRQTQDMKAQCHVSDVESAMHVANVDGGTRSYSSTNRLRLH
uniref:Rx_N domain-containing protein n=1 Tax=Steinernema glaseri TaxID=37863 RepID=A0A1I8ATW2_9BILA